jgi:very-short-patch-repair endonuclease
MKFILNDPLLKQRRKELRHKQTEAEKAFWRQVQNRRFYGMKFYRQYSAGPYILDFYCPQMKLAVELDGGQHACDENRQYDAARTEYLQALGIEIIRFWNDEVLSNTEGVLARIAEIIPPS